MIDFYTKPEFNDFPHTASEWMPGAPSMDEGPESEEDLLIDNFCGAFAD